MTASTLLRHVQLWNGNDRLPADSLRIRGTHILELGSGLRSRANERVVDGTGLTAIPGLIDAHVHMELDPSRGTPPALDEPRDPEKMAERATAMVRAGITTARDLGGGTWAEMALRDAIKAGTTDGPRLLCAGQPVTTPSGHCHFWGGSAADADEARAVIERQIAHGADLVKVMATGGLFTRGSNAAAAQFDQDALTAIVAAAASHHLPVAAHCHGVQGIEFAARAGVRTIEHCSWMGSNGWGGDYDEAIARVVLEHGAWVSPTVNRGWQRYIDNPDPRKLDNIRGAFQAMQRLGIPFIASTDAGIPGVFHHHLPEALAVFARILEAEPATILRTATHNAARALGLGHLTGLLAPGYAADILLIDGDPLEDLAALTRPAAVWAAGRDVLPPG